MCRKKLAWHPTWTPEVERWTAKQIQQNLWRFDKTDGPEDVMQEARLVWLKIERHYPIVNEASHFFALYKTALKRMFVDKVRKKQNRVDFVDTPAEEIIDQLQLQGMPNYGYFNLLLEELPDELKTVLRALTSGRVRLKLDKSTKKLRPRENLNMRLKRRLPELSLSDPVGELQRIFHNS